MSNNSSSKKGHLLVLRQTDRWSSTIIRQTKGFPVDVRVFEAPETLLEQISSFPNCVLVVELSEKLMGQTSALQSIWERTRKLGVPVISAGDFTTQDFHLELIQAGFAENISSTADSERLLALAVNYLEKQRFQSLSIEGRVERDLPWGTTPS